MRCPSCNHDNPGDASFCEGCGAKLELICPACKASVSPGARFCRKCGIAIDSTKAAATTVSSPKSQIIVAADGAASQAIDGERKTVTALFADIKGSTELMEDLDPEEARAVIDPALKLMIEAVRRYDGYVVQSTGDGIFALFGAPLAHEDHPQRALYAALRMQEELERYSAKVVAQGSSPIQGRVGINTGEVVVRSIQTGAGQVEYTPIGHTTNLASRMQTAAPVGSIAVSEATRKLCEGYFVLKPLGATRVKGVSEPVNVYEVTGLGPLRTRLQRAAGRGLTKFVGREREMEALKHAAEQAKAGRGQIVAAMAEPGVGKSRLFFEFKATAQSGWMVLETFSVSHSKASAYLPVIDLLRNYFDITTTDDERRRREKVAGKIAILDRSLEETLPYLFALLGIVESDDPLAQMDGQIRKRRTLEAIKRILLRESLNQPLMVIFEDLHWIDEQTQELLNLLADSIGTAKILLLVNYRPEYSHQWNSKTYYTQLRLDPLGKESAKEMLSALLGASPAPATQSPGAHRERPAGDLQVTGRVRAQDSIEELKRLIIERTEGNPFFMEEMVQALFDGGALARNGDVHLTKSLAELKIPPTVQAILASRIDRLPPDEKELLQTLAVIGREFAWSLVRRMFDGKESDELERMLADLQIAEFIHEQPAAGDIEYIFKHALTQEVASNSLLVERRKQIHEQAAQCIESLFAANLADHYEAIARHYGRSGNVRKAVSYLQLAAQQAMNRSAYAEASGQLDSALELLRTQPDDLDRDRTEIAIRFNLAICVNLSVRGAFAATAALDNIERARELSEKVGDDTSLLGLLAALAFIYNNRFEKEKARTVCEKLLSIATRRNDPERIGHAWCWLGFSSLWEGNFSAALEQFDRACKLPVEGSPKREVTFGNWRTLSRSLASQTLWLLGYPDRAAVMSRESVDIARGIVDSASDLVATLFWAAFINLLKRDGSSAYRQADEAGNLARDNGLTALLATTAFGRAWALVQIGKIEEGLSEMVRWRTELLQTAAGTVAAAVFYLEVAEVYLAASRRQEGLEVVAQGLALMEGTGTGFSEAEMRRLKGELLLLGDNSVAVEAAQSFRDAIELARRQSAKSWELRATMSLARLLATQGRRDEARTMLAEIYNWFTEGFDTADLIDARALLAELN